MSNDALNLAGSLCLSCGRLPAPEVDVCPSCGETAYRSKELEVAMSVAKNRRDVRFVLTLLACTPHSILVSLAYFRPEDGGLTSRLLAMGIALVSAVVIVWIWERLRVPEAERALLKWKGLSS
jgi:hypothetical protein